MTHRQFSWTLVCRRPPYLASNGVLTCYHLTSGTREAHPRSRCYLHVRPGPVLHLLLDSRLLRQPCRWEYFTTLWFEWEVYTKRRPWRWSMLVRLRFVPTS